MVRTHDQVDLVAVVVINHHIPHRVEQGQEILDTLEQQTKHLHQMDGVMMVVVDIPVQLQIMPVVAVAVLYKLAEVQQVLNMPVPEVMEVAQFLDAGDAANAPMAKWPPILPPPSPLPAAFR